uniref:Secreted protein n=1 Tax=Trypanosoma vivax (strain Y486) TaxID=1055687 RepID=G0U9A6_TRYVY|nr:hypothetical protein TVY486_1116750 [Trypanosoma vivax Y486]
MHRNATLLLLLALLSFLFRFLNVPCNTSRNVTTFTDDYLCLCTHSIFGIFHAAATPPPRIVVVVCCVCSGSFTRLLSSVYAASTWHFLSKHARGIYYSALMMGGGEVGESERKRRKKYKGVRGIKRGRV